MSSYSSRYRKTAFFMPGSCWNLNLASWFADEGSPARSPSRPESLTPMLRLIFSLSALAAGLVSSGAFAAPSVDGPDSARPAEHGALMLAQEGNIDIYYDARGNRVLVDADAGKVIAIQPP